MEGEAVMTVTELVTTLLSVVTSIFAQVGSVFDTAIENPLLQLSLAIFVGGSTIGLAKRIIHIF